MTIDGVITDFFKEAIARASLLSPQYETLWRELYRMISAGGKRHRPFITILAYEAFGGTDMEAILPIAVAQEILHLSMLVHDDIIDRDFVRYGVPTVEAAYQTIYKSLHADQSTRNHLAQSAALIGGDALVSSAYEVMALSIFPTDKILVAQKNMSQAIFEVIGGQLLDIESSMKEFSATNALIIARHKTASYTFINPLVTGALMADAAPKKIELLRSFGENIGIGFQFCDDINGTFGIEEKTGKLTAGDIREGKHTILVEQFYANASTDQKKQFDQNFGKPTVTDQQISEMKKLLIDSGALQKAEEIIASYENNARSTLKKLHLPDSFEQQFEELITKAVKRNI